MPKSASTTGKSWRVAWPNGLCAACGLEPTHVRCSRDRVHSLMRLTSLPPWPWTWRPVCEEPPSSPVTPPAAWMSNLPSRGIFAGTDGGYTETATLQSSSSPPTGGWRAVHSHIYGCKVARTSRCAWHGYPGPSDPLPMSLCRCSPASSVRRPWVQSPARGSGASCWVVVICLWPSVPPIA